MYNVNNHRLVSKVDEMQVRFMLLNKPTGGQGIIQALYTLIYTYIKSYIDHYQTSLFPLQVRFFRLRIATPDSICISVEMSLSGACTSTGLSCICT